MSEQPHHDHDRTEQPSDLALRVKALESLLIEKGLVDPAAIDALIDTYETKVGPRNGARVVARAWGDPAFKRRLFGLALAVGALGKWNIDMSRDARERRAIQTWDRRTTSIGCIPWNGSAPRKALSVTRRCVGVRRIGGAPIAVRRTGSRSNCRPPAGLSRELTDFPSSPVPRRGGKWGWGGKEVVQWNWEN